MLLNTADKIYFGAVAADRVYRGTNLVWQPASTGAWGPDESLYPAAAATEGQAPSVLSLGSRIGILSDGRITHIRYWRASGMVPSRTVMIWSDAGALLFSKTSTGAPGWNIEPVSPPLEVSAGATIRVAYGYAGSAADGNFGFIVSEAVHADTTNLDFISGCYHPGGSADFPDTLPGDASNYYADVIYQKKQVAESWGPDEVCYGPGSPDPGWPADPNTFTVGARMTVLANGRITGLRHYRNPSALASRYVGLWSDTGTLLASGTTSGDVPGWNVHPITPVSVTAGQVIRAAHAYSGNAIDGAFPFSMVTTNMGSENLRWEGGVYSDAVPSGGQDDFPANAITPNHYFGDVVFQKRLS